MATTTTTPTTAFYSAGVMALRSATLTAEDYSNALNSLLYIDPATPPAAQAAFAGQFTQDLAYFTTAPDGGPQLVVPSNSPSFQASSALVPSPTLGGGQAVTSVTTAAQAPTTLTLPAGSVCPSGWMSTGTDTASQVRDALASLPLPAPADLTVAGQCIPAPTVTTLGKYITQDDFLSVSVTVTVTTSGLTLNARVLDCVGVMHYLSESLDGVAIGATTTFIIALTPGYLLDVSVADPGANLALGAVTVAIGLQHSAQTGLAPTGFLAQGYVSGAYGLSWPGTPTGAPATPPPAGGGNPPGVRGTGLTAASLGAITVSWPTGTLAGDLAIISAAAAYFVNTPSGWTTLNASNTGTWYGATFYKVLTSGDISTGNVVVHFNGTYDALVAIITFIGATHWVPATANAFSSTDNGESSVSMTTSGSGAPNAGDLAVYFSAQEYNSTVTFNRGTKQQQGGTGANVSGALYTEALAAGGQVTATAQFSARGPGSSAYQCVLIVQS